MGFLRGRASFERFRVVGKTPASLGTEQIEILEDHAIGKLGAIDADGTEVGLTGGDHLLDTKFALEKNLINDALHFGFRVDTSKIPSPLLNAYTEMELEVLAADNPSGLPTRKQRTEAKEAAQQQLEAEARDGRFRRMRTTPVLWDARQGMVLFGSSSQTAIEQFAGLFKEAFDLKLERQTAGVVAHDIVARAGSTRSLEDLSPSAFQPSARELSIAWIGEEYGSRDFLGNEMLLWLWWMLDNGADTFGLPDDSSVTVMMHKTLALECPLAETGKETITAQVPIQLPEAKQAILFGKLPRKSGLILVRHEEQYELTLQAENLAFAGAALPKLDSDPGRAQQEDRIDQLRHLCETLDLLYETFLKRRTGDSWNDDLKKIRLWLGQEAKAAA